MDFNILHSGRNCKEAKFTGWSVQHSYQPCRTLYRYGLIPENWHVWQKGNVPNNSCSVGTGWYTKCHWSKRLLLHKTLIPNGYMIYITDLLIFDIANIDSISVGSWLNYRPSVLLKTILNVNICNTVQHGAHSLIFHWALYTQRMDETI